eukprot:399699_1
MDTLLLVHVLVVAFLICIALLSRRSNARDEADSVPVIGTEKPMLPKHLSQPPIAYPTIWLTVIAWLIWMVFHILYYFDYLSYATCFPIWITTTYALFTPLHEATHNGIATRKSGYFFLNGIIGRICAITFVAPFPLYRYVHLQHHKFTNLPNHDPDYWSISGPWYILPIKWFLQRYKYCFCYMEDMHRQPWKEVIEVLVFVIAPDIIARLTAHDLFSVWMLPGWIAATYTVLVFGYIPHRDHASENVFHGTNVTSLYGNIQVLTIPLLYQNYHIIHHLYPWVPFYRYSKVWYTFQSYFIQKGTPIRPMLPLF